MINIVYKRYHKLKYLLRVKHYKGRKIHSPFMYTLMRRALMGSHNHTTTQSPIYRELRQLGFKGKDAGKVARVYHFLSMNRYSLDHGNYMGEEMVIMPYNATYSDISDIISKIDRELESIICLVIPNIYKSKESRATWRLINEEHNIVGVDIFSIGLIFVSSDLQKQSYKLRI